MTKEEYRELEILLGGLQVVGLTKSTEKRLEKILQVIQRDKQLLINDVVKSFYCEDKIYHNKEVCKKQCIDCKSKVDNGYKQ